MKMEAAVSGRTAALMTGWAEDLLIPHSCTSFGSKGVGPHVLLSAFMHVYTSIASTDKASPCSRIHQ